MSMIVARMQKMKSGNLVGIGNHNQRKTENHTNKEIDPSLSKLNYDLVGLTENYKTDIEKFINENKSTPRAVRKDAVLINEWIISSNRDFFKDLSQEETKNFFSSAKDYFAENFGEENIRYAIVHLDESTPHMHMGIVPFDKDNKLSAKRVFNREALRNIQEDLPKYLQEQGFEIKRGLEGSDRKNLTVPEFKEMKREQKEIEREIERKKDELKSYLKDRQMKSSIDNINPEKEFKEVKVPSGEKFLGHEFTKTVKKPTGNLIISEKDFKNIQDLNFHVKKSEAKLLSLLDTDLYQENRELKRELEVQNSKNDDIISDYNKLARSYNSLLNENDLLKDRISDLKAEISLIYKSTRDFLKDRTSDLKAFKTIFKDLVDDVSAKTKKSNLENNFKKEFDLENKKNRTRGMSR